MGVAEEDFASFLLYIFSHPAEQDLLSCFLSLSLHL